MGQVPGTKGNTSTKKCLALCPTPNGEVIHRVPFICPASHLRDVLCSFTLLNKTVSFLPCLVSQTEILSCIKQGLVRQ
jgi:hypothetical protein